MDGPVLSGGVILLVAVLLWVLYFLPTWRGRHQFYAAERNAVRLNQALRVLAETSEMPGEVQVELTARTALAQQKLAKRVQSEKEAAELAALRAELAAAKADPVLRQARARRRVRLGATVVVVMGIAALVVGLSQSSLLLNVVGAAVILLGALALQRMASVARRAARRSAALVTMVPAERVSPPLHDQGKATWTPRRLPEPLVSVSGSLAQAARAGIDAKQELQRAARAAQLRERAEQIAPPAPVALPAARAPYEQMGVVDDAEIEAHVRKLLAQRAAG